MSRPTLCDHRRADAAMLAHRLGRAHHGRRVTRHTMRIKEKP